MRRSGTELSGAIRQLTLCCLVFGFATRSSAEFFGSFFSNDIDVITVTDVTKIGRTYPTARRDAPVYYKIIDLGYHEFGRAWAGERIPTMRQARKWLMTALAEQGYLLADAQHAPAQLLVFVWGMTDGIDGAFFAPNERMPYTGTFMLRPLGIYGKIFDLSEGGLFLGLVRSYTVDSDNSPDVTLLWETRFGCPARGSWMTEAMPLLIKAAGANFGRETKLPVDVNAVDLAKGRVDLGELKILGVEPGSSTTTKPEPPDTKPSPR